MQQVLVSAKPLPVCYIFLITSATPRAWVSESFVVTKRWQFSSYISAWYCVTLKSFTLVPERSLTRIQLLTIWVERCLTLLKNVLLTQQHCRWPPWFEWNWLEFNSLAVGKSSSQACMPFLEVRLTNIEASLGSRYSGQNIFLLQSSESIYGKNRRLCQRAKVKTIIANIS